METAIRVGGLRKTFRAKIKHHGVTGAFRNAFSPEYRTVEAVRDISFSVERGELLAFIGPNGAGKSTTIKLITGILHPDGLPQLEVLGLSPSKQRKQLCFRIGTVFGQKSQLWFHLPPLDSFRLLADIYDLDRRTAEERISALTEIFEIGDYLQVPVRKLSLGERIRCEIAASMIHKPEILFLDEPTIGLDVVVKQRIRDLIARINREDRTTIFLTSHDAGDIEKICKRVIVINHGSIVLDDSVKNLKYSFFNRKVIELRLESPLRLEMPGVTPLKIREYSAKLEVDVQKVTLEQVISRIVQDNRVLDITVSNPPMEEVIASVYARGAELVPRPEPDDEP